VASQRAISVSLQFGGHGFRVLSPARHTPPTVAQKQQNVGFWRRMNFD